MKRIVLAVVLLLLALLLVTSFSEESKMEYAGFDIVPVPEESFTVQHDGIEYVLEIGEISLSVEKKSEEHYLVSVSGKAGIMDRADVDVLYSPESLISNIISVMMKIPDGATYEDCDLLNGNNESIGVTQEDVYTNESGDWIWLTLGMYYDDGTPTMNSVTTTMTCGDKFVVYEFDISDLDLG